MYRWMQDHGKKLMAFFGVILMIAFILPTTANMGAGGTDPVIGKVNGQDVRATEYKQARNVWEVLDRDLLIQAPNEMGMPGWAPLSRAMGAEAYNNIQAHPDLFLILLKEAESMGVRVSNDTLESVMQGGIYLRPTAPGQQPTPLSQITDPRTRDNVRHALTQFILVQNGFGRAASVIKVSQPMRREEIGLGFQRITVNAAEFPVAPYVDKVPAPTTQQLDEQFKQYANVDPNAPALDPKANLFGFGYRYPNRVKLQYLTLPRAAVVATAERARTKDDAARYEWDRAAYQYYTAHPENFTTTAPASTQPSLLIPAAAPKPTTKPFDQSVAQARESVLDADANKLSNAIEQRINAQLVADYAAWKNAANGATRPTTAPATALGAPYGSFDYLKRLAESVQKQFGVLPTVNAIEKDWQTEADLAKLPGIGQATLMSQDFRFVPFPTHAISTLDLFLPESVRNNPNVNSTLRPSPVFRSSGGDLHIYRVTDAQLAHAPADKSEVLAQVTADVRAAAAFKLAHDAAQQFLDAAKSAPSLTAAPGATAFTAGPFTRNQTDPIPGYPNLSAASRPAFQIQAFDLLTNASDAQRHPRAILSLPKDGKALAAELTDVTPGWNATNYASLEAQVTTSVQQALRAALQRDWFNYANTLARTHYEEQGRHPQPTPTPNTPSEPRPPLM